MCGHRLTRPYRADFTRGVIANREHEIEWRGARLGKLRPRFGTKMRRFIIQTLQELNCVCVDLPLGLASRAVCAKSSLPDPVQDSFGHDRACRVSGAEKQDVEGSVAHTPCHDTPAFVRLLRVGLQTAGAHFSIAPWQQFSVRKPSSSFITSNCAA